MLDAKTFWAVYGYTSGRCVGSYTHRQVFGVICAYAAMNDDGSCSPSYETIAAMIESMGGKCSVSTVERAIGHFEQTQQLVVFRKGGPIAASGRRTHRYIVPKAARREAIEDLARQEINLRNPLALAKGDEGLPVNLTGGNKYIEEVVEVGTSSNTYTYMSPPSNLTGQYQDDLEAGSQRYPELELVMRDHQFRTGTTLTPEAEDSPLREASRMIADEMISADRIRTTSRHYTDGARWLDETYVFCKRLWEHGFSLDLESLRSCVTWLIEHDEYVRGPMGLADGVHIHTRDHLPQTLWEVKTAQMIGQASEVPEMAQEASQKRAECAYGPCTEISTRDDGYCSAPCLRADLNLGDARTTWERQHFIAMETCRVDTTRRSLRDRMGDKLSERAAA